MNSNRNTAYLLLALIPFVCLVYLVANYMVDVPYWDQWALVPLLEKSYQGSISFNDLWMQNNEHRILFPKIIMLTLARLSNWKISYELAANIFLAVGIFLTITYQFKKTAASANAPKAYWAIPIISLITFSMTQSENWLWGWQIQVFLNVLTAAAGFLLLANHPAKWPPFCFALLLGIIATFSFATGLTFWPIGLLVLFLSGFQNKKTKTLKIAVWAAASLTILCAYLYNFQESPDYPPLKTLLFAKFPLEYTKYILAYLGTPLCWYRIDLAILFGLTGLIIAACLIYSLTKSKRIKFQLLLPFIALTLYPIASAAVTGIGRMVFGSAQAMHTRYTTISNLLWFSNLALFYLYLNTRKTKFKDKITTAAAENNTDKLCQICAEETSSQTKKSSFAAIIVILIILNSALAVNLFKESYQRLAPARRELQLPTGNDQLLKNLYPDPKLLKTNSRIMKKLKLSAFRNDKP